MKKGRRGRGRCPYRAASVYHPLSLYSQYTRENHVHISSYVLPSLGLSMPIISHKRDDAQQLSQSCYRMLCSWFFFFSPDTSFIYYNWCLPLLLARYDGDEGNNVKKLSIRTEWRHYSSSPSFQTLLTPGAKTREMPIWRAKFVFFFSSIRQIVSSTRRTTVKQTLSGKKHQDRLVGGKQLEARDLSRGTKKEKLPVMKNSITRNNKKFITNVTINLSSNKLMMAITIIPWNICCTFSKAYEL